MIDCKSFTRLEGSSPAEGGPFIMSGIQGTQFTELANSYVFFEGFIPVEEVSQHTLLELYGERDGYYGDVYEIADVTGKLIAANQANWKLIWVRPSLTSFQKFWQAKLNEDEVATPEDEWFTTNHERAKFNAKLTSFELYKVSNASAESFALEFGLSEITFVELDDNGLPVV